ncbi:MAG: alpha,alpha-trehalase TreA [Sphingomonadales bacterium]|nr:MAG: alpha,alpha-trehalase TreA [Sphingomonadales bacterium]
MTIHQSPSERFGALFATVQESSIFADSKTFADAKPRRAVAAILADWHATAPSSAEQLRDFVEANFILPMASDPDAPRGLPLDRHILALWDVLTRTSNVNDDCSEIALPRPYVVPGGRFRELYYWDSYFTMLGLARSGRQDLVEDMIADFGSLLDRFGHIPNGTRSYYLSRSHPPFFYLMASLSKDDSDAARRQRLAWMRIEHAFWMAGADALAPGDEHRRVVRLADGALLNRYWDDSPMPRDESWREDVALAKLATQPAPDLWRNLRAAAESGWDFSSRWLVDGEDLATIRTTRLVPVDLNCLLHGLETAIAHAAAALGDDESAAAFAEHAAARARAVSAHLWDAEAGHHADLDLDTGRVTGMLTAAAAFPLFAGLAHADQATRIASALASLLRPGGLATTATHSGQQWDAPNGWAPLQWIAVCGLRAYGAHDLADQIAGNWMKMIQSHFTATGSLLEKYDVEARASGGGGEYPTETGFGWTNGVFLALSADAYTPA